MLAVTHDTIRFSKYVLRCVHQSIGEIVVDKMDVDSMKGQPLNIITKILNNYHCDYYCKEGASCAMKKTGKPNPA